MRRHNSYSQPRILHYLLLCTQYAVKYHIALIGFASVSVEPHKSVCRACKTIFAFAAENAGQRALLPYTFPNVMHFA